MLHTAMVVGLWLPGLLYTVAHAAIEPESKLFDYLGRKDVDDRKSSEPRCIYEIHKPDCLSINGQCKRLESLTSTPECPIFSYFSKCDEKSCTAGVDHRDPGTKSKDMETAACLYYVVPDAIGCQKTDEGCEKMIKVVPATGPQRKQCQNFDIWVPCPKESCLKIQPRLKNAPRLNHECGYEFIRGLCEWQQSPKSCSRNNVFKPSTQGKNCKPLEFIESCQPDECTTDSDEDDLDQEIAPTEIRVTKSFERKSEECVYRTSKDYCRYHIIQSQAEPSCVALETKIDDSGRLACPRQRNWTSCPEWECLKRCDEALTTAWSSWICMATCYSSSDAYARGVWPYRARYRSASKTAPNEAKFCKTREEGACQNLPKCQYNDDEESRDDPSFKLTPTRATRTAGVMNGVIIVGSVMALAALIGSVGFLIYFRHDLFI